MPQLDKVTFSNQVFWLLLTLFVLYLILILYILPLIHKIMSSRRVLLQNFIQKGYLYSNRITKNTKYNSFVNFSGFFYMGITMFCIKLAKKFLESSNIIFKIN